ncbi:STAS domain-containing protein [Marmoricola sp. Leaf446]|uniref:STAS domain-containing protein n=1 Tax=Marmoricola sp. Leaf446 TaxID=1736379 RepID=UPI00138EEDEB|nr:STAS domain-containing protein [Marmoricola sp. Leaf446]
MTTRETHVTDHAAVSSLDLPDGAQADLRLAGEAVTVTVRGELDLHTASCLRQTLEAAVCEEADLVLVHLDEVTFMDSTALGVLVGAWKAQTARGRRLEVVCSRPEPLKLLRLTGLDGVLDVHPGAPVAPS